MRRVPTATVALACLMSLATATLAEPTAVDETRKLKKDASLHVENIAGSIRIEAWNKAELQIDGELGEDVKKLEIRGGESKLYVEVRLPRDMKRKREGWANLTLKVPAGVRLKVDTVSADIDVSGVTGSIELASVSGDIGAEGGPAEAGIETVSGDQTLSLSCERLWAHSVSGRIVASGLKGEAEVETVSGQIRLECLGLKRLSVESVSGDARIKGELDEAPRLRLSNHSGDLTLRLPKGVDAEFAIATHSGDIDSELGPKARRSHRHGPGRELDFTEGKGRGRVIMETFSGDVEIEVD
jgi:DUF4097 and DUF4098 domain-containing protein YvlB